MDLEMDGGIVHVGALVDEVSAVVEIEDSQIQPPPSIGDTYKSDFITGVAKTEGDFIMILDLIKIFSTNEINFIKENMEKASVGKEKEDVEIS